MLSCFYSRTGRVYGEIYSCASSPPEPRYASLLPVASLTTRACCAISFQDRKPQLEHDQASLAARSNDNRILRPAFAHRTLDEPFILNQTRTQFTLVISMFPSRSGSQHLPSKQTREDWGPRFCLPTAPPLPRPPELPRSLRSRYLILATGVLAPTGPLPVASLRTCGEEGPGRYIVIATRSTIPGHVLDIEEHSKNAIEQFRYQRQKKRTTRLMRLCHDRLSLPHSAQRRLSFRHPQNRRPGIRCPGPR